MRLEWLGVHSGWPFGEYGYTSVLGGLIYGIPWSNFVAWFVVGGLLSMVLPRLILTVRILRSTTFLYRGMLLLFGLLAWQANISGSMIAALSFRWT